MSRSHRTDFTIYISGPTVRGTELQLAGLAALYRRIQSAAVEAEVAVHLPIAEMELDRADPQSFAREIRTRIDASDAMVTLLLKDSDPISNYSIGAETQQGAAKQKPVVIVAQDRDRVPRLLEAIASSDNVTPLETADFVRIFQRLRRRERPANGAGTTG